jgi:glutamate-1-semialdehyde aminotransferase
MDLTAADKSLGHRRAIEGIKRGVLVNPNETVYVSVVHTDADVDRSLEVAEQAFQALLLDP